MNRKTFLACFLLVCAVAFAATSRGMHIVASFISGTAITGSTVDSTPIGSGSASTVAATSVSASTVSASGAMSAGSLNTGSLQVNGTAPSGHALIGNGSTYVDSALPSAPGRTCNGNGCYVLLADGTLYQWGSIAIGASGNFYNSGSFSFPHAFTTIPVVTMGLAGTYSTDSTTPASVQLSSVSTGGASAYLARTIVAGAGGGNFDQTTTLYWQAFGY